MFWYLHTTATRSLLEYYGYEYTWYVISSWLEDELSFLCRSCIHHLWKMVILTCLHQQVCFRVKGFWNCRLLVFVGNCKTCIFFKLCIMAISLMNLFSRSVNCISMWAANCTVTIISMNLVYLSSRSNSRNIWPLQKHFIALTYLMLGWLGHCLDLSSFSSSSIFCPFCIYKWVVGQF